MFKPKQRRHQKRYNSFKKFVKHFDAKRNRNATNQTLHQENYDDLSTNTKAKHEDVWAWD